MFHLFDRKYLTLDAFGVYDLSAKQRLYITDYSFDIPFTPDPLQRRACGILGVFVSLEHLDSELGSREEFWKRLLNEPESVNIVVNVPIATELMIQFWKSVFKQHTVDTLYLLYELYMNHDNALAYRQRMDNSNQMLEKSRTLKIIQMLTKEEFAAVYEKTPAVEALRGLPTESISFEYQMLAYLSGTASYPVKKVFYSKVEAMATRVVTQSILDAAAEILENTTTLDLQGDNVDQESTCPLCMLKSRSEYAWIFSNSVNERDADKVLKEFGLARLAKIMQDVDKVHYEPIFMHEIKLVFMLANKQYDEVIELDIQSGQSSIFSKKRNRTKVNSLLIGYFYRLKRLNKLEQLTMYELA